MVHGGPFIEVSNAVLEKRNGELLMKTWELEKEVGRLNRDIEKLVGLSPAYREGLRATYQGQLDALRADLGRAHDHFEAEKREIAARISASLEAYTTAQHDEAEVRAAIAAQQAMLDAQSASFTRLMAGVLAEARKLEERNKTLEAKIASFSKQLVMKLVVSLVGGWLLGSLHALPIVLGWLRDLL